jgi:hypothetical protein
MSLAVAPPEIGNLDSLYMFAISHSNLGEIPRKLVIAKLRYIYFEQNQFEE